MISWSDFKAQQPELARRGMDLLYHFGVGEFQVQAAMLTQTTGHGDPRPQHTIWRATRR